MSDNYSRETRLGVIATNAMLAAMQTSGRKFVDDQIQARIDQIRGLLDVEGDLTLEKLDKVRAESEAKPRGKVQVEEPGHHEKA